jgi:hypothetical protein
MSVLNKIRKPMLISGLALLIAGAATFFWIGGQDRIRLITGISDSRLIPENGTGGDSLMLGFSMVLDSIRADAAAPDFKLLVWALDTSKQSHSSKSAPYAGLVAEFPLDTMKIRAVGESDHRFRLVEYYPDFAFQYTYSGDTSWQEPKAPGITIDLKTPDGSGITTLRSDQPGKHKLDDKVGLGCVFEYYRSVNADSLAEAVAKMDQPTNKVIFSGQDGKVYFLFDGQLRTEPLAKQKYYPIPGTSDLGFTVLIHFPDAAYLKAIPASASDQPNKPVAQVEIWKLGGPATEVFLYPNTKGRVGGDHRIRGTNAMVILGESPKGLLRRSDIYLRAGQPEAETEAIVLRRGKGVIYNGKYISPLSCHADYPGSAILSVRPLTGFWIAAAGLLLVLIAALSGLFPARATHSDEKDQRTN